MFKPESMCTVSGVEKSPPQRSPESARMRSMKHLVDPLGLRRQEELQKPSLATTFMSIAWPTMWLERVAGVTIAPDTLELER